MRKIKAILFGVFRFVTREIFFIVPFLVLFHVGVNFTAVSFTKGYSDNQYKILIGAIGLAAMLAGLTLRLSNSADDTNKKKIFYEIGERLSHTTLLFVIAIVLKFSFVEVEGYNVNLYLKKIIQILLTIGCFLFFWYGIVYASLALARLHRTLYSGHEKPLD